MSNNLNPKFNYLKRVTSTLTIILLCLGLISFPASSDTPPTYPINTVVELCDEINEPSNVRFQRFGNVVKSNKGWLVSEKLDLQIDHNVLSQQEKNNLSRFANLLQERKIDLILVPTPPRGLVFNDKMATLVTDFDENTLNTQFSRLLADIKPLGKIINTFDLAAKLPNNLFYKSSFDWTPSGAKWYTEKIADFITQSDSKNLATFAATPTGQLSASGAIRSYAESICNFILEPEYSANFTITKNSDKNSSAFNIALLGDRLAQQERFQFAELLAASTASTVLNYAQSESSHQWGWLQLIDDIVNKNVDVSTIVWQFQANQGFASNALFRQLIAVLNEGCSIDTATVDTSFAINMNSPSTEVLMTNKAARFSSSMMAELTFINAQVKSVELKLWFDNGSDTKVSLSHALQSAGDTLFYIDFLSLNVPKDVHLLALEINNTKLVTNTSRDSINAELKLCSGQ